MSSAEQSAAWRAHPNASGPASMMLSIHDQFRAVSQHIVELVAQGSSLATIERAFSQLAAVLHHHHHAEEAMVFPFVERRTGIAPEQLQTDHDEMTAAIANVESRLEARETERVGAAIGRFHEILVTHLDREEDLVIPVFLALTPAEVWALLHA